MSNHVFIAKRLSSNIETSLVARPDGTIPYRSAPVDK